MSISMLPRSRETSGDKAIYGYTAFSLCEPSASSRNLVAILTNELAPESLQSIGSKQYVNIAGGTPGAVGVDRHRPHDGIGNARLLQASCQAPHRLMLRTALLKNLPISSNRSVKLTTEGPKGRW